MQERERRPSVSRQLRAGPRTSAEARWFLSEALERLRAEVDLDTALLLTSEVAANAAKHGEEPIDITVSMEDEALCVSVFDHGPGFDPGAPGIATRESSGWGLRIVGDLASDWGVERRDEGTEVWFRL